MRKPVVLITGAGSGFGKGASLALAERGHSVIATTETEAQAKARLRQQRTRLALAFLPRMVERDRGEIINVSSIEGKTASCMATASRIGAMVSNVSADSLDALTQFGHHLGMCFQVVDDVLDATGTDEQLGKPAGSDVAHGKRTFVTVLGIERARALADASERRCAELLDALPGRPESLAGLAERVYARDR